MPFALSNRLVTVILLSWVVFYGGCSVFIANTTTRIADNLSASILNSNDLQTVKAGAPAYLILLDGLLQDQSNNKALLLAASKLNSAYAGVFADDKQQQKILSTKALNYALNALCISDTNTCGFRTQAFDEFKNRLDAITSSDLGALYAVGAAWTTYLQANASDFNAIAELSKVRAVMERVVSIDEEYDNGTAYLYLGGLNTLLPPALGGKPEVGKEYFDKALSISKGKNLLVQVIYAQSYAKLVFDRELHDTLLNQVLAADPNVPNLTLTNTLAQQQATQLLKEADDYF